MWRITLLGRVEARRGDTVVSRFESSRVAALLARLVLAPRRQHPREELAELLWPGVDRRTGLERLRHVLSSLRAQLEPPGTPVGSVLVTTRQSVALNPDAVTSDVAEFERRAAGRDAPRARAVYGGELLPGFYDDWVVEERYRLEALRESIGDTGGGAAACADPPMAPLAAPVVPPPLPYLPSYLTAFVGREREREALRDLLTGASGAAPRRLVTVTGIGGGGKTRLSAETARSLAEPPQDGAPPPFFDLIAFAPLADIAAPGQIPDALRLSLELPTMVAPAADGGAAAADPWERVLLHLTSRKRVLLVLDNLEHLAGEGGATLVERLLHRAPGVTCLVTSRRLLGIPGEVEFPLAPLATPDEAAAPEAATDAPSVRLFLDRAQAARPGYQITQRNHEDVTALCRMLDGLPLALELAASRMRALSPAEMRRELEASRFDWLARRGGASGSWARDKEDRHRSLAAALDGSFRLLAPSQRHFFAALSVFRGAWSAEAAAAVTGYGDALDRLEALAADSLAVSAETPHGTRFRLLETVRAYAGERLREVAGASGGAAALRARHRAYYLTGPREARRDDEDTAEPNRLAAWESAVADGDFDAALAALLLHQDGWVPRIGAAAALRLGEASLALPGGDPLRRQDAYAFVFDFALLAGEPERATALVEQAFAEAEASGAPASRARARVNRARVEIARHQPPAQVRRWLEEALTLARDAAPGPDTDTIIANAVRRLGLLAMREKRFEEAQSLLEEAVRRHEALGQEVMARYARANLADLFAVLPDGAGIGRALELYAQVRRAAEVAGDPVHVGKILLNVAALHAQRGDWQAARAAGRESVTHNRAVGNRWALAFSLWNLPEPLLHLGEPETAARLMGFAEHLWQSGFGPLSDADEAERDAVRGGVEAALGPDRAAALWSEGAALDLPDALALALGQAG